MNLLSSLVAVCHLDFSKFFAIHSSAALVKMRLEEFIICVATNEIDAAGRENNKELYWKINFVQILHEFGSCLTSHKLLELLIWLLFVFGKPVAEFSDLEMIIIALL